MARPVISPEAYFAKHYLDIEKEKVFMNTWLYAGNLKDLSKHNDFVTLDFMSFSLVVQNFSGELRCFVNVCTHRFSRLQAAERGNRPLICPYHAWSFNKEGVPQGIPQKPHFGNLDAEDMKALCLKAWDLEVCGQFVFVKHPNASCDTLSDYLGHYYNELLTMSSAFSEEIDYLRLDLECNWKIAVENTLESYHVAPVHSKTFYKLGASGENFVFDHQHSSWHAALNEQTMKNFGSMQKHFPETKYAISGYKHIFIYPNLTIATTNGTTFSVQRFSPLSEQTTRFESWVFGCVVESPTDVNLSVIKMVNKSVIEFNRQVFQEDKDICREVQRGVVNAFNEGVLSDIEERVMCFQTIYKQFVH